MTSTEITTTWQAAGFVASTTALIYVAIIAAVQVTAGGRARR